MSISKKHLFMSILVLVAATSVYWPDIKSAAGNLLVKGAFADVGDGENFNDTPTFQLEKTEFAPEETIKVYFTAPSTYPESAWIGIVSSNVPHGSEAVNDKYDVSFQYLNGQTAGTLVFHAPDKLGSWDVRMNDDDNGGKEVASISFTVR